MIDQSGRCVRCGFPQDQCECAAVRHAWDGIKKAINPWSNESPAPSQEAGRPQWEFVPIAKTAEKHPDLYRLRVATGWLYKLGLKSTEMTFVPG
jgi:hypothetical protein